MSFEKAWHHHIKQKESHPYGYYAYSMIHEQSCQKGGSGIPLNEETCNCYERMYFRFGYMAAKGLTPNFRNRDKI